MLKKFFALAAVAAATIVPAQALTLAPWNFNSVAADTSAATGSRIAAIGAGTASLVGGTTSTLAGGDANGGSTDPVTAAMGSNDSGWNTTTYAAQGTGNQSRGAQFLVDTTGYADVMVSWDQRLSTTTARYTQFQYTTDGTTFVDAASGLFMGAAGDTWYNSRSVDLSGVAGTANNANVGVRIVAAFAPTSSGYVAASTSSHYATTGSNRFDRVTVNVTAVPEPESDAAMLAGLGAIGLLVDRRRT